MNKAIMMLFAVLMALVLVAVPAVAAGPGDMVAAVNTTAIDDMADTIVALLIALIPVLLILAIWTRMKGIWAVLPFTVMAVNTTAIDNMADTIVALLIALIPILLIIGIWGRMKKIW